MRFLFACLFNLFVLSPIFAQNKYLIKPENADCQKAIEIKDTIFGPTNAPSGYGNVMEVSGDKNSLYSFEQEHNTVWYFFKVKNDCLLELDIIPVNKNDDYDFVLYKYNGKTFFSDLAEHKVKPVRTCISRNDKQNASITGLSKTATDEFIHSGPGASFSKAIDVRKNEIYYLCVDNVYPKGNGHTVLLHYSGCRKVETVVPKKTNTQTPIKTTTTTTPTASLTITAVDKDTKLPVKANLKIYPKTKAEAAPVLVFDSVSSCVATLPTNASYVVKSEANNYFDNAQSFTLTGIGATIPVKIEMSRIKVGQNIVFENILFYSGRDIFLPESHAPLEVIASTMKRYPTLKIEIQGHVNCPSSVPNCEELEDGNMQLSVDRAKAVKNYLEKQNIAANRMTFKGFGSSKMIYPNARSEEQMQKNRRVEIIVMGVQ